MKKREIASLACRFFSLGVVYQGLVALPPIVRLVVWHPGDRSWWDLLIGSLLVVVLVSLAVLLWRRAGRVATYVVLRLGVSPDDPRPSLSDVYGVALFVFGLYVITDTMTQLRGLLWALISSRRYQYQFFDFAMRVLGVLSPRERLVSWIARMTVGVGLIVGSQWLAGILNRPWRDDLPEDADIKA